MWSPASRSSPSPVSVLGLYFGFVSAVVFLADHFVRPALIGVSTRLPFLWIFLGIFGGLETFGLIGSFGLAIMAAVMAIWREGSDPAKPHRVPPRRTLGARESEIIRLSCFRSFL